MNRDQVYSKWEELNNLKWDQSLVSDVQAQFEKATLALYKRIVKKSTKNFPKAFSYLKENNPSELEEVRKPFEEEVNSIYTKYKTRKEILEQILENESKEFEVKKSKELCKVASSSSYDFSTQPSHNKYARERLREDETLLQILGYKTEVKTVNQHSSGGMHSRYWEDYELWSNLSEFDFYMLKKSGKFVSTLNWAVLCWQNGTNPKVYFQFLGDDDYEKSQVLAYQCDYNVNSENMELELSWDEIEKLKRKKK